MEEVTLEGMAAGMVVSNIIGETLDESHTKTDTLRDRLLATSPFRGTNLTSSGSRHWRSLPASRDQ